MIRYLLTVIHMSRSTRRRIGKSRTIELETNIGTPEAVERWYEDSWGYEHSDGYTCVKVIDVREGERQ